jgi:enediyne biosynthesis protein E4
VTRAARKLASILATMLALLGCGFYFLLLEPPTPSTTLSPSVEGQRISPETAAELASLEAREIQIDQTIWASEIKAQEHGRIIEEFWDAINRSTNKLSVLPDLPFAQLILPNWTTGKPLPHDAQLWESAGHGSSLAPGEFKKLVTNSSSNGWELQQIEFRHNEFFPATNNTLARSRFYFSAHLINKSQTNRASLEGDIFINWSAPSTPAGAPTIESIDASSLSWMSRVGEPPFKLLLAEDIVPIPNSNYIDPLILNDLDGDGLTEIILAGRNLVYLRNPDGSYRQEDLCTPAPGPLSAALIADFDMDGRPDFLCQKYEGLFLYKGLGEATFTIPPRTVFPHQPDLQHAMVMTCGDVDADGDLDLFIAQYREPYEAGATPRPFYDANDGWPAYFLLNNGRGDFSDGTVAAGLAAKRWRRTYSCSFVDLDSDSDLDLVVVSDFAGLDLYRNNGLGQFEEVTNQWSSNRHAFGMAHALADFNLDGRLDLLMMGMTSPTVERLEHLGLWRSGATHDRAMRTRMTSGNRLLLARADLGFEQTSLSDTIARSGWSWGCSVFDFDNDSFPDVYIANGLESNSSVREYEPEYWLHDQFMESPEHNPAVYLYFRTKFSRTRDRDFSYGGYDKNRFFINNQANAFLEMAHLFGVAIEEDCRNVVSDDLDGDGRVDLLVTSYSVWPAGKQTLRVYRNVSTAKGNWIGFRFRENGGSAMGARIILYFNGGSAVRALLNGDSYRSQHSRTLHFGLGSADKVEYADVFFANGNRAKINNPAINTYHDVPLSEPKK